MTAPQPPFGPPPDHPAGPPQQPGSWPPPQQAYGQPQYPAGSQYPGGPPQFTPAPPGPQPGGQRTLARKKRLLVLPIVVIVIAALVTALILVLGLSSPQGWVALSFTTISAVVTVLILFWIDRWEPEPPLLLIAAFGWGAAIAPLLALLFTAALPMFSGDLFLSTAVRAPLTEETAKGLFFLVVLMSTRRGRAEFNSLTDALVYAGLIGAGFSFTEDILYISGTANVGDAIQLSVIRVVLGGFGHMLYTGCVAVGFWLAMRSRGVLAKVAWILAGWLVGMLLHGLHNAATAVGALYFLVLGFDFLVFVALVIAAIWSSIREGKVVARQLPAMVDHGWIHASDAGWLGSTAGRKSRAKIMKRTPGGDRQRLRDWVEAVTELAYVRERLDHQQGNPDPHLLDQHQEYVDRILQSKDWVTQTLAGAGAGAGGWPAIAGQPGPRYAVGGYPPPQAPGGYPPPGAGYPPPGR
ncbi:PrsW family intramembrane metalloprotease [Granulicoccus phenolivorans]|uniref:PrsW family intramembrane metalloprotease n=1 Tax=Granulicoccus phenolivorans TaxID=266854 RepID=UPI000422C032|nr:PrsW family intramembrane metalloprotease [Granulicoccus phenolivorans]